MCTLFGTHSFGIKLETKLQILFRTVSEREKHPGTPQILRLLSYFTKAHILCAQRTMRYRIIHYRASEI